MQITQYLFKYKTLRKNTRTSQDYLAEEKTFSQSGNARTNEQKTDTTSWQYIHISICL